MDDALLLFAAGFLAWTISSLSAGGGSLLLVAVVSHLVGASSVAPIAALASLIASLSRLSLFWRSIDWQVVRWYLPGAVLGAVAGGWALTRINAAVLQIVIALFLISTVWQFRFGHTARSFPMRLQWFIPLSMISGFTSGLAGASGLLVNPFYLNYGLNSRTAARHPRGQLVVHSNHEAGYLRHSRHIDARFDREWPHSRYGRTCRHLAIPQLAASREQRPLSALHRPGDACKRPLHALAATTGAGAAVCVGMSRLSSQSVDVDQGDDDGAAATCSR